MKYIYKILFIFLYLSCYSQDHNDNRPNILFIAVDDLKPTIGAYEDEIAITPNLDKLSENATTFHNNHTQQAICGPARASIMTGKRPDYTKVWDLKTKMRDMVPDIVTIPQFFKNNGYETIGLGKIFDPRCVDQFRDKPSWTVPYLPEHKMGYPKDYGPPAMGFYQNPEIKSKILQLRNEAKSKGVKDLGKYIRSQYKPLFQ